MSSRRRHQRDDIHVPYIVVTYLGRISAGAMLIGGFLTWRVVETSSGSDVAVDAAVVGLVTAFIGFGSGGVSALGAILASTRSSTVASPGEPGAPPIAVEGVPGGQPVPVADADAVPTPAEPEPDPGESDPADAEPDPAVVEGPRAARVRRSRGHSAPEDGHVNAVFVIVGTCVVAMSVVFGTLLLRLF